MDLLFQPTNATAAEAPGFINLFDDYLAPQLMEGLQIPVDLIWGEQDPWEHFGRLRWAETMSCVQSIPVSNTGHCLMMNAPHQ